MMKRKMISAAGIILASFMIWGCASTTESAGSSAPVDTTAEIVEQNDTKANDKTSAEAYDDLLSGTSEESQTFSSESDLPDKTSGEPSENVSDANVSREYRNALASAQSYSDLMHMSKQGIYDQLTSEYGDAFPDDAAQYAIDHVDADWNENALATAETYYQNMSMSISAIYDQLASEYGDQFTADEAQYAVDHLTDGEISNKGGQQNEDISQEYKNALASAQSYSDYMHLSKKGLYDQLTSEYGDSFPEDAAQYAVDHVDADWKQNALESAKSYYTEMDMSKADIYDQLTSEYGDQFTAEEAQYAIDHLDD